MPKSDRDIRTFRTLAAAIRAAVADRALEEAGGGCELILDNDFVSGAVLMKRELLSHVKEFQNPEDPNHPVFTRRLLVRSLWTSGYLLRASMLRPHRTELVNNIKAYDATRNDELSVKLLDEQLAKALQDLQEVEKALSARPENEDVADRVRAALPTLSFRKFVLLEAHLYDDDQARRVFISTVLDREPVVGRPVAQVLSEAKARLIASEIFQHRLAHIKEENRPPEKAMREAAASDGAATVLLAERRASLLAEDSKIFPRFVSLTSALSEVLSTAEFRSEFVDDSLPPPHASADNKPISLLDDPRSCLRSDTYLLIRGIFSSLSFIDPQTGATNPLPSKSLSIKELEDFALRLEEGTEDDSESPEDARSLLQSFSQNASLPAFIERVWVPNETAEDTSQSTRFHKVIAAKFPELISLRKSLESQKQLISTIVDMDLDEFASEIRTVSKWARRAESAQIYSTRIEGGLREYLQISQTAAAAAMGIGRWVAMLNNPIADLQELLLRVRNGETDICPAYALRAISAQQPPRTRVFGAAIGFCIGQLDFIRAARISQLPFDPSGVRVVGKCLDTLVMIQRHSNFSGPIQFNVINSRIEYLRTKLRNEVAVPECLDIACAWLFFYWLVELFMTDEKRYLNARNDPRVQDDGQVLRNNAQSSARALQQRDKLRYALSECNAVIAMLTTLLDQREGAIPERFGHENKTDPYDLDAAVLVECVHHIMAPDANPAGPGAFDAWRTLVASNRGTTPDASVETYREFINTKLNIG